MPISPTDADFLKKSKEENSHEKCLKHIFESIDRALAEGERTIKFYKDSLGNFELSRYKWVSNYDICLSKWSFIYDEYRKVGWNPVMKVIEKYHWFAGENIYVEIIFEAIS